MLIFIRGGRSLQALSIGLVKKHRGYERTNENGTERIRMEEIQNLVRISCVVRLAKLWYNHIVSLIE